MRIKILKRKANLEEARIYLLLGWDEDDNSGQYKINAGSGTFSNFSNKKYEGISNSNASHYSQKYADTYNSSYNPPEEDNTTFSKNTISMFVFLNLVNKN
jgi:hypothetical protein